MSILSFLTSILNCAPEEPKCSVYFMVYEEFSGGKFIVISFLSLRNFDMSGSFEKDFTFNVMSGCSIFSELKYSNSCKYTSELIFIIL